MCSGAEEVGAVQGQQDSEHEGRAVHRGEEGRRRGEEEPCQPEDGEAE